MPAEHGVSQRLVFLVIAPLVALLLAATGPAWAAEESPSTSPAGDSPAAEAPVQLPPVQVTDQKEAQADGSAASGYRADKVKMGPLGDMKPQDVPFSVDVVSSELIKNTQAANTAEALKYVPSVYVSTGSSQITPYFNLRGFSASTWTYNMALDGMRSFDIYEPLDDKERLEVLRGATGFLYGVTSPGGMINYVSKQPTAQPLHEVTMGLNARQVSGQMDLGGPVLDSSQKLAYRLNLAYGSPGSTWVDHQGVERRVASGVLDWRFLEESKLSLEAAYAEQRLDYAQALFMTTAAIGIPKPGDVSENWGTPNTGSTDVTTRLGAALESKLSEIFTLRSRFRYSDIQREYFLVRQVWQDDDLDYKWRVDSNDRFHNYVNQYNLFLDAHLATGPLGHKLSAGLTWDGYQGGDPNYRGTTYATIYPGNLYGTPSYPAWTLPPKGSSTYQQTTYGTLILSDQINIGERWSLLVGATRASVDDDSTTKTAAGKTTTTHYDAQENTPALSLSFKPIPQVTTYVSYVEALQQGLVVGSSYANAGQTFDPYVSKQKEAGVKASLGGMDLAAAYFDIEQANQYISNNVVSQDGREVHKGWEFSASGKVTQRLTLLGGFTLLDATIAKATAYEGNTPQGVPEKMARAYAEYDLPGLSGLTLCGGVSYIGKVPWDAANTLYVDPVTLLDAGLRYRTEIAGRGTTFRLGASNLTGEDYWSTRSGILYLGNPRTVTLSVTTEF